MRGEDASIMKSSLYASLEVVRDLEIRSVRSFIHIFLGQGKISGFCLPINQSSEPGERKTLWRHGIGLCKLVESFVFQSESIGEKAVKIGSAQFVCRKINAVC